MKIAMVSRNLEDLEAMDKLLLNKEVQSAFYNSFLFLNIKPLALGDIEIYLTVMFLAILIIFVSLSVDSDAK